MWGVLQVGRLGESSPVLGTVDVGGKREKGEMNGREVIALGVIKNGMGCPTITPQNTHLLINGVPQAIEFYQGISFRRIGIYEIPLVGGSYTFEIIPDGYHFIPPDNSQGPLYWKAGYPFWTPELSFPHNPATFVFPPGGPDPLAALGDCNVSFASYINNIGGIGVCALHVCVRVRRVPNTCSIMCKEEAAVIPDTRVQAIINDVGFQYNLPGYNFTECLNNSAANVATAEAIRKIILQQMNCDDPGLTVTVMRNGQTPNCVSVLVKNSPIRLGYLKAGDVYYPFNQLKC